MEEMHRASCGEKQRRFHTFSRYRTLPVPTHIHLPRSSVNLILLGYLMEVSLRGHSWLNHWPLVINSTSSPSLRSQGGGTKSSNSNHRAGSPGNQPPSLGGVQKLLCITRDTLIALNFQEIPRV